MKRILQFLRTTLVGGILFLVPIIALVVIIGKALVIADKLVAPLAALIPIESIGGIRAAKLLAIGLLVFFCFLAGVLAKTAFAKRMSNGLEAALLSHLPGYEFIKGLSGSVLGVEDEKTSRVVLARIEDAWQIAFLIERLESGRVAVFVPGAPSPQSGSVYFMTEDRIKLADIPPAAALKCLRRLGAGSNALLGGLLAKGERI